MSAFYDLSKTPRNILNQAIVRAIVSENNGALFDPSDLSTLYHDAAGTIPVTAVEQPVGLMLDKSRGLILGPELVSNGTFDSGIAGWEQKYNATTSYSLGSLKVMPASLIDANGAFAGQAIPTAIGRSYKVTFDLVTANAATYIRALNNINAPWAYTYGIAGAAAGNKSTLVFTATATVTYIAFGVSGSGSLTNAAVYDNISVRELYGYHATQSITASRPVLSARYNLLTNTEDFSDAAWVKSYCTITKNTTTGPFGGTSASTITSSISTNNAVIYQVAPAMISGATYTVSRYVKAGSVTKCTLGLHQLADIYFDLNELTYNAIGTGFVSASIVDVGSGWRKITGSWVWSGSIYNVYFALASTLSSQSGVPVGGTLHSFGHSLTLGTTSGPYQRVNTATDYDTDERYFKKYLRFDGVDDYLVLPYMGLYANGSASVVAGASLRSNIAGEQDVITEGNSSLGNPFYNFMARPQNTSQVGIYIRSDSASTLLLNVSDSAESTLTNVLSSVDSGGTYSKFVNGLRKKNVSYSRSGALTLNNTTIGAYVSATTSNYASMKLYGLIVTKSALTDAQRVTCERYLGRKSGVTL